MKRYLFVFFLLLSFMGLARTAASESIVLRAMVANPSEAEKQKVPVELPLPREAGKKDIVELSEGLSVLYDSQEGLYKVVGEITLKPGEEKKIQVRINDIWRISKKDIQFQKGYLPSLLKVLSDSEYADTARQIEETIKSRLSHILTSQEKRVSPSKHIEIYRENLALFDDVKESIRFLEKLASTKIPMDESLIEAERDKLEGKGLPVDSAKAITLKMLVRNPSKTERALLPVNYYLPRELRKKDVLDPGGLEVRYDPDRGTLFLHKDEVALAPDETKIYDIILRDIWRVEPEMIQELEIKAAGFAQGLEGTQFHISAVKLQKEINKKLSQIIKSAAKSEGQPVENKVEVYMENLNILAQIREQVDELARMEVVVTVSPETAPESMGLESPTKKVSPTKVAKQSSKKGLKRLTESWFKKDAPDKTAVWRLIFMVIGFLGFVSFLFYIVFWIQVKKDSAMLFGDASQKGRV